MTVYYHKLFVNKNDKKRRSSVKLKCFNSVTHETITLSYSQLKLSKHSHRINDVGFERKQSLTIISNVFNHF